MAVKPGVAAAVVVGLAGASAAGAVWLRDGQQLSRARQALDEGRAALGAGDLPRARTGYEEALLAADGVGGLTARRGQALEVADAAREALGVLDALVEAEADPRAALRAVGPGGQVLGKAPDAGVQRVLDRARAEVLLDAGLRLDARGGVAAAPKVLEAATEALRAVESQRLPEAEQALGRARFRARLAELEADVRQARDGEAEQELAALRAGLDDALATFAEADRGEVRARLELAAAEVSDRQGVKRFEEAVAGLARRVPTNDLGRLRREVERLAPPKLRGGHPDARALELRLEEAGKLHARVLAAARDFEGMVLARREGARIVFVDATEVTNEAFARFVAAGGYAETRWWTSEAQALLGQGRFKDKSGKPAPEQWRDAAPPADREQHPVTGVCVHEAQAYGAWCGKRLPTLAEWRSAATGDRDLRYPWGDAWQSGMANVKEAEGGAADTKPVGSYPGGAGPTGAQDVIGNVRELVLDGADLVAAGGSYQVLPAQATAQTPRRIPVVTLRTKDTGFRCARDLVWE